MTEKRKASQQTKAAIKAAPSFQLSLVNAFLNIQSKAGSVKLTPEQTNALRAFLLATPEESENETD